MGNEGSQPLQYRDRLENDVKVSWGKSCTETPFSGREGHCSASLDEVLYVFGGVTLADSDGTESNELLKYDCEKEEWSLVNCKGNLPKPRSAAAMASVEKNLYVFGGLNRDIGWLNDFHMLNTESNTWSEIAVEGIPPSARDKLACTVIGKHIYFFGGFGPKAAEPELEVEGEEDDDEDEEEPAGAEFGWFNDLFIFDTVSKAWSSPMQMNLGVPTARAAHGMCAVDHNLVIFGGRDSEMRRNDLHIFDTETRKWISDLDKVVSGRQPEPRSFHTVTAIGNRVVVCGGRGTSHQHYNDFHIFDTKTREWLQPHVEGSLPAGRGLHTATLVKDKLLLFGGSSEFNPESNQCVTFHNDLYYVNADTIISGSCTATKTGSSALHIPDLSSKTTESTSERPTTSTVNPLREGETTSSSDGPPPAKIQKTEEP